MVYGAHSKLVILIKVVLLLKVGTLNKLAASHVRCIEIFFGYQLITSMPVLLACCWIYDFPALIPFYSMLVLFLIVDRLFL